MLTNSGFKRSWARAQPRSHKNKLAAEAFFFPMAVRDYNQLFQRGAAQSDRTTYVPAQQQLLLTPPCKARLSSTSSTCEKQQAAPRASALAHPDNSTLPAGTNFFFPRHISRVDPLLLRQRRGRGNGLGTTLTYLQKTTSAAACSGFGEISARLNAKLCDLPGGGGGY
jgi:hypothetical protein